MPTSEEDEMNGSKLPTVRSTASEVTGLLQNRSLGSTCPKRLIKGASGCCTVESGYTFPGVVETEVVYFSLAAPLTLSGSHGLPSSQATAYRHSPNIKTCRGRHESDKDSANINSPGSTACCSCPSAPSLVLSTVRIDLTDLHRDRSFAWTLVLA